MKALYVNPFTDYGFKKIFGEEACKPILKDFLNSLLPESNQIKELSFKNSELLGTIIDERKAIFDLYCENELGEKFIVELQKAKQNFFKERTVYYSTFPIREQAEKGNWNFNLKAVFCIGILDFTFDDYENESDKHEVIHNIKLKNQHGKTFYEKLTYIYLEMPNFNKTDNQLYTRLDQWLYFLKHLEDFTVIPQLFKDSIFEQAFEKASIATLTYQELEKYEGSLKVYRDWKNVMDTAFDNGVILGNADGYSKGIEEGISQGIEQGIEKGITEGVLKEKNNIARILIAKHYDNNAIVELTGLSIETIELLRIEN